MTPDEAATQLLKSLDFNTTLVADAMEKLFEWLHRAQAIKTQPQRLLEEVIGSS
jgi:hypothetical protein